MVGRYRPLSRTSTHINQNAIGSPRGELMAATGPRGMKIGAVSLWLLLLLSEKPMYGYEVIRELEKRFSGYWRPKTGTIYPAFEKLEEGGLVTSRIEFRDEGLDRKHYALTEKGRTELAQTMSHWTKMMEVLENYREVHESIFRYKDRLSKEDLSKALVALGQGLGRRSVDLSKVLPGHQKKIVVQPTEPVTFKLLYAKEDDELEIHMEVKWPPTGLSRATYALVISFLADRIGRRKTLVFFALTDFVGGTLLFVSRDWWAPVLAGIVGNMTVGAGEVGPFLSLEQAMIPKTCRPDRRTLAFSAYNLVGYGASSAGALLAGLPNYIGYSPLFLGYLISGLLGAALYSVLSGNVEPDPGAAKRSALSPWGRPIVAKLSALFAIDSFGGGFIGQSILSYYFYLRFGLDLSTLGVIFFATQLVTALSFLLAERIARRIGLLRTMVFTHVPSNVLLIAVAFAPTALSAVFLLLCRQSLSQMAVPSRRAGTEGFEPPS